MTQAIRAEEPDSSVNCKRNIALSRWAARPSLVFVTTLETCHTIPTFGSHIAWESEVWIAENPDHMTHFKDERSLGPYPQVMREHSATKKL